MKDKILLTALGALVLGVSLVAPVSAAPVVLDFDTYPAGNWQLARNGGSSWASGSILTIDAPARVYHEFILRHPHDEWHQKVSNWRGWVIETRLRVDPSTDDDECSGSMSLKIWAHDHTNLVQVGFGTDEICIRYPDIVRYSMDTTDGFHVYRIESRLDRVKIYVDGDLVIDHVLSWPGGGSDILMFGDGSGLGGRSLSYWDYLWYEVFPERQVEIDVKPGTDANVINPRGNVTVAILTSAAFDAASVDPETATFEGAPALRSAMKDVDRDGDDDMLLRFSAKAADLSPGQTEACVGVETVGGVPFDGCDSIRLVAPRTGPPAAPTVTP